MDDKTELQKLQQRVEAVEEENEQLRQAVARTLPNGQSRRSFLKLAAAGTAGLVIGGGATHTALADADTNDQYGDVGTPSSRVDVFADGVNTASITDASSGSTYDVDTLAGSGAISSEQAWEQVRYYDTGPSPEIGSWSKDSNNPVLEPSSSGWDSQDVAPSCAFRVGSTYHLFYFGRDTGKNWQIGHATSTDLTNWSKDSNNPVIQNSQSAWDTEQVAKGTIVRVGDTYHHLFDGSDGSTFQIGHATSTDLVNWTRNSNNPVLTPSGSGWDDSGVAAPTMYREGEYFRIIYGGYDGTNWSAGHAHATDLSSITKSSANPVLAAGSQSWEGGNCHQTTVLRDNNVMSLLYASASPQNIGFATAPGEITDWRKEGDNPVLTPGGTGSVDEGGAGQPVLYRDPDTYHLFYKAINSSGTQQVAHATLDVSDPS